MKTIKFRAWDSEKQEMYIPSVLSFCEGKVNSLVACDGGKNRKYVEHDLMLFTGLTDKNGKEIFEGDIILQTMKSVKVQPNDYEVIFKYAGFSLIDAKRDGDKYGVFTRNFPLSGDEYEVIGNNYENPELLS